MKPVIGFSSARVNKKKATSASRLAQATSHALESLERRVLMSTTVAAWNFDSLTVSTTPNLSPAPSTGTGTAYSIGLQTSSGSGVSPQYPADASSGASGTGDISDILNGTGNNPSGNQADHSSTGATSGSNATGTNPAWRIRGSSDGWSSNAAPGTQGAQFSTSTVGQSGISVSFDLDPSSGSAPSEIAVQYTTDGSTWTTLPASDLGTPTSATGATTDVTTATGSGSNMVSGGYFQIANSTTTPDALYWQNGFTANLSGITGVNNNANFGIRIVNAASGGSEFEVGGTAYPTAGAGNWRLDNIVISATGSNLTAPTVTTNPTNQTVAAGQPVSFTAAASGTPSPTVQWYSTTTNSNTGGTLISGATSPTLTFTTSSTAADNGTYYYAVFSNSQGSASTTAAELNDPLAAPVVTTEPTSVSTTAGTAVTFTSAASGSPVPTEGWQVSTNGTTYTPITSGSGGYTINSNGSLSFTATSAENGYKYEAVFTNSQAPSGVDSNPATLTLGGTLLTAWNFSNAGALIAGQTILNPGPSTGTGTSASLGMGSVGTYSVYPGDPAAAFTLTVTDSSGTYTTGSIATGTTAASIQSTLRALHPATTGSITVTTSPTASAAAGVVLTGDTGATLTGSGSGTGFFVALDAQATTTGLSSSQVTGSPDDSNLIAAADTGSPTADSANINAWRIVGTNGWNSNAPIGTQGSQFLTSTSGYFSIEASFDLYATTQGEAKMQVEYTTDGSTWTNVPAADLSVGSGDTGISVLSNSSSANTVQGGYFDITAASANSWYNNLGVNLTGISGVNNNANFGIRIVNAATGADCVNISNVALNNSSGNDRIGDVQITGNNPVLPAITTNPTSQSVASGSTATFTAAATGYPTPTVQWYSEAPGASSFTADTTDSGNTTTTLKVVASQSTAGTQYEAVFTNSVGSATTTAATLSVGPVITTNPASQTVAAGTTNVTFTAAATGTPTPTVQWEVEAPGATSFTPVTGANFTGTTTDTLTIGTATESLSGDQFEAVFTNSAGSATTTAATLTVLGTPIAQWNFTGGEAPAPDGNTSPGTGNSPSPTFGPSSNLALTNGLDNNYTGINTVPESDVLLERSTLNPSFSEYDWRIRSGNGSGPTGSPGTPEGWSQNAPEWNQTTVGGPATPGTTTVSASGSSAEAGDYEQGVQFDVNTTGYSNITMHFDWNEGGISDMQPVYSLNGGQTWTELPNSDIEEIAPNGGTSADFYGITPTTSPSGITVNLQGITGANNDPNFELQLDAAYSPSLPNITDGNQLVTGSHGQYATGVAEKVNAQQVVQFNSGINNGDMVPLTYGGQTASFAYSSTPETLIANMTTALNTLVGSGNFSVAQTNYTSSGSLLQPLRDGLGIQGSDMTITFKGTLAATPVTTITTTNSNVVIATWVNGSANGYSPYVDGGGAWQIGNISFNGDSSQAGGLSITTNPSSTTGTTGYPVTFTAAAYSENAPVTAQWYDNGTLISGATNISNSGDNYTSTYTFTPSASDNGDQITCTFTQGSSSVTSQAATLTVVSPSLPIVVIPPQNASVEAGDPTTFTSTATGSPSPTVQWQISSNDGSTWTNLTNSATVSGATTTTLDYTTNANASENGDEFRAVFTNAVGSVDSSAATLTVLSPETVLTDWDFNNLYPSVSASSAADPYVNSPAPVAAGVDSSVDVGGTATAIGFNLPYNGSDPATGSNAAPTGSVNADDITNTPGSANPSFNENTWRIRGGANATTGGTPANGWSNLALPYTQGAQFSVPTTGYANVYVTMDWYSTTSGELDAQPQYTVDGTNWINLGNQVQAVSNDFYGATSTGGPIPLTFNVSNIPGAANNPNFGIRLVNAYDPYLTNTQYLELGDTKNFTLSFNGQTTGTIDYSSDPGTMAANVQAALGALSNVGSTNVTVTTPSNQSSNLEITFGGALSVNDQPAISVPDYSDYVNYTPQYANAALVGTPAEPAPYNGSKGNWRFDNIVFHGDPTWLDPKSSATWNEATQQLTITGAATITGDPTTTLISKPDGTMVASNDLPVVTGSAASDVLSFTPTSGTATDFHIGGVDLSNGADLVVTQIDAPSSTDTSNGSYSADDHASDHDVLVIGSTSATSVPVISILGTSKLDLADNDLIIHTGSASYSAAQALFSSVQALGQQGRNAPDHAGPDGPWTGNGLTSSTAQTTYANDGEEVTALAVAFNADYGAEGLGPDGTGFISWPVGSNSETVGANDIIVKYTYFGDADLEGKVYADASAAVNANFTGSSSLVSQGYPNDDWAFGDFDGSGAVNANDAAAVNAFYGFGETGSDSGFPEL